MAIVGWRQPLIQGELSSRSQVFAAHDWHDMVLSPGLPIAQKAAVPSRQITAFAPAAQAHLTAACGLYTDVQSVNSEDTVTWSVFGCVSPDPWLGDALDAAFGTGLFRLPLPRQPPTFWRRLPHPVTGSVANGPEVDMDLPVAGGRILAEAKWRSDISRHRGGTNQLRLRSTLGHPQLLIVPGPAHYPPARKSSSIFRRYFTPSGPGYVPTQMATQQSIGIITWEDILRLLDQRSPSPFDEVATYLRWRLHVLANGPTVVAPSLTTSAP